MYVDQIDGMHLTEAWVAERVLYLLDQLRPEDAQYLAEEHGIDWGDGPYSEASMGWKLSL